MRLRELARPLVDQDFGVPQIVTVWVRWFLIATWLVMLNYRPDLGRTLYLLDGMGLFMLSVNAYLHYRIVHNGYVSRQLVQMVGGFDLIIITAGIAITTRFDNNFFVAYYPALLYLSLLVDSGRWNIGIAAATAAGYSAVCFLLGAGVTVARVVDASGTVLVEGREEKVVIFRVACMFAVVAAGYAVPHVERKRRAEAVERARRSDEETRAAEVRAERAAQDERREIRNEIHDGVAQSVRALGLEVESIVEGPDVDAAVIKQRLSGLVPMVGRTLDEIYEYLHDIEPILSGDTDLEYAVKRRLEESARYLGVPFTLEVRGTCKEVPVRVSRELIRILQEALTNTARHAHADSVKVALVFTPETVALNIDDDGKGFDPKVDSRGIGLESMTARAARMSGEIDIDSEPGRGTSVRVRVPLGGARIGGYTAAAGG